MKFELESHIGVTLVDPEIKLRGTFDDPTNETFTPSILFVSPNINIAHTLPAQPYVDGTWTDEDVQTSIDNYLNEIQIK